MLARTIVLSCLLLVACGDDETTPTGGGGAAGDGGAPSTGGGGSGEGGGVTGGGGAGGGCAREPGPPNGPRSVVVGHPYDASGAPANTYEVLSLSAGGELASSGATFTMGRPVDREIVFTPDGELGFAVQDDGSVGVFRIGAGGAVEVLESGLRAGFYATALAMSGDGSTLYVLDPNFPKNGGGIYTVSIGCDDTIAPAGKLVETKSARALHLLGGDAVLTARGVPGSPVPSHVHRLTLPSAVVASADAFGHDDAILSWAELTRNGRHLLVGDNSAFSAEPNRVAVVEVTATGIAPRQMLEGIDDPYAIAASPFDDAAIVTSGFGDGIFVLDYAPASAAPFTLRGELPYVGTGPQLPGALAMVRRGSLDGLVLIADVRGVYMVAFAPDGEVVDRGIVDLGGEVSDIVSGVGVQP